MTNIQKPYIRLWAAVLEQAIKDLNGNGHGYGNCAVDHSSAIRQDAINWFKSDRDKPKSFIWICRELGYNPDFIRTLVSEGQ